MFQMVRKLKYHEQKLLRKVDFINWEADNNLHEVKVMKKFFIQKREDYTLYNKLSREIRDIVRMIKDLDPNRQHRTDMSAAFLEKMYSIGLIPTKWNLELCDKINASSFCRRRYVLWMLLFLMFCFRMKRLLTNVLWAEFLGQQISAIQEL